MKPWWGIVAAACALALALPASAAAAQTEVQRPVVSASLYAGNDNGYLVLVGFPSPKIAALYLLRIDRGETRALRTASYVVRARSRLVNGVLRADFGKIGSVKARFVPSGKTRRGRIQRGCTGPRPVLEGGEFRGTVKLRGEDGYFRVAARSGAAQRERSFRLLCRPGWAFNLPPGLTLRDYLLPNFRIIFTGNGGNIAQLRAAAKIDGRSISLLASHGSGAPAGAEVEVSTVESAQGMAIGRTLTVDGGEGTLLTTLPGERPGSATLAPPAPFHGEAQYTENSSTSHTWSGSLSATMPGLQVPLTGPRFYSSLCVMSPLKNANGCDFADEHFPMFPERLGLFPRWAQ